jgi:16S rRNA (guanine966-N2)-methyltransferase
MRVIAGKFKGRRLVTVKGMATRPILDRVKESLFSILADRIIGARVLDLFCGAGTLGIECLSRGSESVVMIDISRPAQTAAVRNITALGIGDRVEFLTMDYLRALRNLAGRREQFNLIFLDPPYFKGFAAPAMAAMRSGALPAAGGLLVYRHHKKENAANLDEEWEIVRQRQIGDAILTFYQLPDAS